MFVRSRKNLHTCKLPLTASRSALVEYARGSHISFRSTSQTRSSALRMPRYVTFTATEVNRLLSEGIIEPSMSPWQAQFVMTSKERHKKMIDRFIPLDAYSLPKIKKLVNKVAQYKIYCTTRSQYLKKTKSILPLKQMASYINPAGHRLE